MGQLGNGDNVNLSSAHNAQDTCVLLWPLTMAQSKPFFFFIFGLRVSDL